MNRSGTATALETMMRHLARSRDLSIGLAKMDTVGAQSLNDALIIGGGPAGLTAAIYLARARRTVALLECARPGRSDWAQTNHNYFGFPQAIPIVELLKRGRQQVEQYGVRILDEEVASIVREDGVFVVTTPSGTERGRAVILAMGVADNWPRFPDHESYIGKSLHWCIVCDGFEMQGKRVVILGNDAEAAEMAVQMLTYTRDVTLLTNSVSLGLTPEKTDLLERRGIPVKIGRIRIARAHSPGHFEALVLKNGDELSLDNLFSVQGTSPNTDLARALGVDLSSEGYVKVDTDAKTNVPGVFAAGDITRLFNHQVSAAVHEGATAATSLNYLLYQQDQSALDQRHMAQRLPPEGGL